MPAAAPPLALAVALLAALPARAGTDPAAAEPEDPPSLPAGPPASAARAPARAEPLPPRAPPEPALEPPTPAPPPPGPPLPPAEVPAEAQVATEGPPEPALDSWLDVGHAFVEHRLFAPILRLDRFFSDERSLEAERARSFVQFRNNLRFRDDGEPAYTLDVRANLRVPGLNRSLERLRVVIAGQTEEALSALLPEGPVAALRGSEVGTGAAELRFGAWEGVYSNVDLGAGLLFQLPVGVFSRLRYRASVPVKRLVLFRVATSGFWRTDTRFGTAVDADLERPLGPASLVRLAGGGLLTQRSRGIEWSSELALLRTLGPRAALSFAGAVEGAQRAPVAVDRWRIFSRFRRDVFRHWVFVELEPEVAWPWSVERGRFREIALTVRLEVQFQGNEPPIPPPPQLREPADPPHAPLP